MTEHWSVRCENCGRWGLDSWEKWSDYSSEFECGCGYWEQYILCPKCKGLTLIHGLIERPGSQLEEDNLSFDCEKCGHHMDGIRFEQIPDFLQGYPDLTSMVEATGVWEDKEELERLKNWCEGMKAANEHTKEEQEAFLSRAREIREKYLAEGEPKAPPYPDGEPAKTVKDLLFKLKGKPYNQD